MELLLNIVWVLAAAGILGIWRTRWVHQRQGTPRHSFLEWTAVSVALILLFFAVSMTDDLHSQILFSEECSTSRRNLSCPAGAHASPQSGSLSHLHCPPIPAHAWETAPLISLGTLDSLLVRNTSDQQIDRPSGRAPPISSL
jgi:hypothetical protein